MVVNLQLALVVFFVWQLAYVLVCTSSYGHALQLPCVVVFVICGVGGSMCVCVCVCVRVQCVCGVGVVYCVSVYVFVHGTSKHRRKQGNEDNKSTGKEDDRCAY